MTTSKGVKEGLILAKKALVEHFRESSSPDAFWLPATIMDALDVIDAEIAQLPSPTQEEGIV